jgi:hypothetical protein
VLQFDAVFVYDAVALCGLLLGCRVMLGWATRS